MGSKHWLLPSFQRRLTVSIHEGGIVGTIQMYTRCTVVVHNRTSALVTFADKGDSPAEAKSDQSGSEQKIILKNEQCYFAESEATERREPSKVTFLVLQDAPLLGSRPNELFITMHEVQEMKM